MLRRVTPARAFTFAVPPLAAIVALVAVASAQSGPVEGAWTADVRGPEIYLELSATPPGGGHSNHGHSYSVAELSGLPADAGRASIPSARFVLHREAGTIAFDGAFRGGRGAGLFTFTPRAEFDREMAALGYHDSLSNWDRYRLAVTDVGPRLVAALKNEGLGAPPLDEMVRAKNHGVSIEYVRDMKAAGFARVTLGDLVRARDHGVSASFVRDLRAEGAAADSLDGWVRLRDHGVTPEYARDLKARGLTGLSASELVRLRDHGVTPGFVDEARARGFQNAGPDELVRLRDRGFIGR